MSNQKNEIWETDFNKKLTTILFALFVITLFSSNGVHKNEQTQENYGEAVFYEIFPSLLDSIHTDGRLIPPPPPPEYFKYMDSAVNIEKGFQEWKKSDHYKDWLENWERKKDSIKRDTTTIYLTIPDSIGRTEENDQRELIEHFENHNLSPDSFVESHSFKIDLSQLRTNHSKVKFVYQSQLPGDGEFWRNDYGKFIDASLGFTKIIFDKTKSYGVLNAGYARAPFNGFGVRIFIKKNEVGDWVIDEVKGTWIS